MGLFDRLFGQEENQSQETVANQEISETEALDNQDLSASEGISESQTEQLSELAQRLHYPYRNMMGI